MLLCKNPFFLLTCTSFFLFASCKKNDQTPPPNVPNIPKIKTISAANDLRNLFLAFFLACVQKISSKFEVFLRKRPLCFLRHVDVSS